MRLCPSLLCLLLVMQLPAAKLVADEPPGNMLMITQSKGFKHGSVTRLDDKLSAAEVAMTQLGQTSKLFKVTCSQDAALDLTKETLQKYNLVAFYTTGDLPIADADRDYFLNDWLKQSGHGFLGFHSATDTYNNYEPYWQMIGGTFDGHPWGSGTLVTITVNDPSHPAMKPLGAEFQIKDEIYQYSHWQPENVRVLMSIDMSKTEPKKPYMVPVSWVKDWGPGRVFVTNLGHNETTWADERFLAHVDGAVRWALGLVPADATPNPEVSARLNEKAKQDAGAVK